MYYKRVLLKLSGEALAGDKSSNLDDITMKNIGKVIKELVDKGIEIAIVIGGGNFWRGKNSDTLESTTADYMGMLATCMNSLALKDYLEKCGVKTKIFSSLEMPELAEYYEPKKVSKILKKKAVAILACGTGHPFVTTDTAAALRGSELNVDAILFAKNIDGVYSDDPKVNKKAKKYDEITYEEMQKMNLKVIDKEAVDICMESHISSIIFALENPKNILSVLEEKNIGTVIKDVK